LSNSGILGAPDAGITTLINIIASREKGGKLHGKVLYDGRSNHDRSVNKKVGYVIKDDQHIANMTVFETLYFSARLRVPSTIPDKVVSIRVKMIMKLLGLSHVSNSIIGDSVLRGISGVSL
jgi:ABC-type multidrug transport system ATPase subunit